MGPALIGAGASLLGGIFGRKSAKKDAARAQEYDKPINVRARAEEGGFNPLLWAGVGNTSAPVSSNNFLGNGIANAGMLLADGMDKKRALKLEETRLKEDRARLDKLLEKQTIRPKVGGIYSGTQPTPTNGPRVGLTTKLAARPALSFPTAKPFEPEAGSGGVDYAGNPTTSISTPLGPIKTDSRLSDAEMAETRYGDITQEFIGAGNLVADLVKTGQHWYKTSDAKKRNDARKKREDEANTAQRKRKAKRNAAKPSDLERIDFIRKNFPTVLD